MLKYRLSAFSDEAAMGLSEQLRILGEEGIGMTELRSLDGKNCAELTLEEAKEAARKLRGAGVSLSALGSPYGKIPIDEPFDSHYAAFLHGLDICRELDCERIRMFSFYMPKGADPALWRGEVFDRLEKMIDAAEKAGVRLMHENEKGIYGDIDVRCEDLLERFAPRMGFVFDPANFIQCGVRPMDAFARLHDRIDYMHIKDAFLSDGAVVCAGEGDGRIPEILKALSAEREGEMILTVEPHLQTFAGLGKLQKEALEGRRAYASPREAFHAAVSAIREILRHLEEE